MKLQQALDRIREIAETLPEDDPDREEMMNTEADFDRLMEWAIIKRNDWQARADSAKELSETYKARSASLSSRAESMKSVLESLLNAAGKTKYAGAAATVSMRTNPPKPVVADETLIPVNFWKQELRLDKAMINETVKNGESIPGVALDNGSVSLTIRTK